MATVRILFNTKFCQTHLDEVISEYWEKSFANNSDEIIFDLSLVEWVNTEEIAFLFAWIRNVANEEKKVDVWLPFPYNIFDAGLYREKEDLISVRKILDSDNSERINRRKNRSIFLLRVWGMLDFIGLKSTSFQNVVEGYNTKGDDVTELFGHLVIPFTVISSEKIPSAVANTFTDVISGNKTINQKNTVGPFDLNPTIVNRLETFNCYSPFESKIISHVITKELFANSLIHSNISDKNKGIEECYFALSLHNKWEDYKAKGQNFINQFTIEKDADTLDFYKDKTEIIKDIKLKADKFTTKEVEAYKELREADLSKYQSNFKNSSFLEFTFLDFGDGIHSTLKEKFQEYSKIEGNVEKFKTPNPETQILEYAFYPESSRNQYDARLEHPELFPRGLYFLIDMVRRYKGLLTVRSGQGKIVYDFSDKIYLTKNGNKLVPFLEPITTIKDAIRIVKTTNSYFEGTMMSIVLPEKKKDTLSYAPVRTDNKQLYKDIYFSLTDTENLPSKTFEPETYEYISMLFLYEKVITTIKPKELDKEKGLDSYIYIELLAELSKRAAKKCVIFIDFEFYPRTDNIQPILFYLTNSPYISEYSKAVIINLVDERVKYHEKLKKNVYSILSQFKQNLFAKDNEPHIFRPIPCINFDLYETDKLIVKSLNWIGVKEEEDEMYLDKLFLGDVDSIKTKDLLYSESLGGSLFADNFDFKYAIFNTSLELVEKFKESRQKEICILINRLITDGSIPVKKYLKKGVKEHFIFQASKGSFQIRYLSLYETLHNKYLAKYLAKRLLDKYIATHPKSSSTAFNRIITVTVSSQLIGVAIRDLIKEDPAYKNLKTGEGDTMEDCPSLIMLSSYYSFEDEKPFAKIRKDDSVIIVNDVISTGSLVSNLIEKIGKKEALIKAVMSITDCRIEKINGEEEDDCEFEKLKNEPLFTLVGYPEKEIEIRKYKRKDFTIQVLSKACNKVFKETDIDIKRINPLLNTVVELSDEYAEKQRILFEDPNELLPIKDEELELYQSKFFKIGHFEQNISHNGYLTNMRPLFSDNEGKRIIQEIKSKIDKDYETKLYNRNIDDATKLFSIISLAEQLESKNLSKLITVDIKDKLAELTKEGDSKFVGKYNYKPNFIFYPIFSGIENFSHKQFNEVFKTPEENIIGLQRFDTDKGWRFPFPPKRFNNITKGKHILIFDSGALTGESLVQMIDSISFLDVARIDVISVIGRIEDYNREFFSRIKALKVKSLNDEYFNESIAELPNRETILKSKVSFSTVNIIFGINFHIPVFSSKSSCPFCEELAELNSYQDKYSDQNFPTATKTYIDKRRQEEICRIDLNHEPNSKPPEYIPYTEINSKNEKVYDIVSIFLMRDKLGKIDSYRFYKEYYRPFDEKIIEHFDETDIFNKREVLREIELILICILHEPKLFKVHKDLLVNIHDKCKEIITDILSGRHDINDFVFKWSKYSIVRLAALYFAPTLHKRETLETIFNFSDEDESGLNYLSYILVKNLKPLKNADFNKAFKTSLIAMDDIFQKEEVKGVYKKKKVKEVIRKVVRYIEPVNTEDVNQALYSLKIFFKNEHSNSNHDELIRLISDLKISIGSKVVTEDIDNIKNSIIEIWKIIDDKVYSNIKTIKKHKIHCENPKKIYINLVDGEHSVYQVLEDLEQKYTVFKELVDVEDSDFTERVTAILNFKNVLINDLQLRHFLTDKWFNQFSTRYICFLEDCIAAALEHESVTTEIANRKSFTVAPIPATNSLVNGHSDFLVFGLVELLINAAKRDENENAILDFEISEDENGIVTLLIKQDKPFIQNEGNHYSGIEKEIKPIFEMFCGKENVYFPSPSHQSESFIVKIVFNKKPLEDK